MSRSSSAGWSHETRRVGEDVGGELHQPLPYPTGLGVRNLRRVEAGLVSIGGD